MGKALVLAEKPSVAKEIAKILGCRQGGDGFISGQNYIVTWALGHLVTLADPEFYGEQYKTWSLETLPMLPKSMELVVMKETKKQFRTVQNLCKRSDVSQIIIATDAGREGELVARWILQKAGCKKPAKRLWISSQTAKAVKEGFASLKPSSQYDNLYHAAQCRAEADWLVGLNVTRALTCKHNAQLSAGRVQTPTLALIVEREEEIKRFVSKDYYTIKAACKGFNATWRSNSGESRLFDQARAQSLADSLNGLPGTITHITKQYHHKAPPAAYDLTELQRDANRKYAYSAKETLSYLQALYEHHKLVTYPRTDSRYITKDLASTLGDRLQAVAVGPYKEAALSLWRSRPVSTKYIVDDSKVSDHHAVIPTEEAANLLRLSPEERNIYDLVVRRFLAVLSPAFEYEETKLTIRIGKENFYAKGKIIKKAGWKAMYSSFALPDQEEEDDSQTLPPLKQGDTLAISSIRMDSGKTKPPARYNEATLLSAMENPSSQLQDKALKDVLQTTNGLGTPATRADIIEKLFSSFYVERKGKEIVPTSKGVQLVAIVPPDLKSAELTARWEQQLERISKGKGNSRAFISEMQGYASRLVSAVIASNAQYVHDNITKSKCPDCGKFLLAVNGKKGKMLICSDRECGYRQSVSLQTNARCPNCHKKLELRGEGEKRLFACICGYRERLSDFEKRKKTSSANKNDVKKYLDSQKDESFGNSALAQQLAKWKEQNK